MVLRARSLVQHAGVADFGGRHELHAARRDDGNARQGGGGGRWAGRWAGVAAVGRRLDHDDPVGPYALHVVWADSSRVA